MPPRSGCAIRSTAAGPNLRLKNVVLRSPRGHERFGRHAQTGRPGQEVVAGERAPRERDAEKRWGRQLIQAPPTEDEGARGPSHFENLIAEAELANQVEAGTFLREHGVGPRLDREAVNTIGLDQSAGSGGRLEHEGAQPAPLCLVRGGETGDARTDDDHVLAHGS